MKAKLISTRPYKISDKGNAWTLTIPKSVTLFTDLKAGSKVWFYATKDGVLLSLSGKL